MLTDDLIARIRRIEIATRKLVDESFAGEYQSVFKGRGMEFDEVRQYHPGDDVRSIDWNVTARTGEPHVKSYIEERELTVMLVVDVSGSGDFGTRNRFKRELAVELAAVMSFAATTNNDKVGLLLFTDRVESLVPPRKGRSHVLRMVRDLLLFQPEGTGTDITLALNTVHRMLKRRSIVFLVSDLLAEPESYRQAMIVTNRRHDVVAFDLSDPMEHEIVNVGLVALEDAESGQLRWVDTGSRRMAKRVRRQGRAVGSWQARRSHDGRGGPGQRDHREGLRCRSRSIFQDTAAEAGTVKPPALPRSLSPLLHAGRHSMYSRKWLFLLVVVTLFTLTVAAVPAQTGPAPGVRVSLVADPTELTVGDLVTLSLIVSHPEDATVVVPRLEREWGPFEVEEQTSVQTVSLADGVRTVARQFRARLFAPGTFETPELRVFVRSPNRPVVRVSPEPIRLTVNSVLSSPDEELKDLRPPADLSTPFWERPIVVVLIAVVALGLLGGTAFILYRRSRPVGKPSVASPDLRTPREVAIQELDRIASLDLPGKGEMKEHYTLVAEVLRRYLGATYLRDSGRQGTDEMSTEEIAAGIRQSSLDHIRVRVVVELLQEPTW